MTDAPAHWARRADELRRAFDQAFAVPPPLDRPAEHDLLGIHLATHPYALRLSEVAGLVADKAVTPVPSDHPALLGIAGFRGAILPVYGLPALLGHPAGAACRWLAIAAAAPLAFAFEGFDGHLRITREDLLPQDGAASGRPSIRESARVRGVIRPIIHLPSLLDAIRQQAQTAAATKER